jgi:hypothetical protein
MLGKIFDGIQSLNFKTLTLSPTKVNWVKRWSKAHVITLISPLCGYHPLGMEKNSWGLVQWSIREFDSGLKQINDFLGGHPISCLKMTQ